MREIKFRAWDKKWQRWIAQEDITVYGDGSADFVRRGENGDKIEIAELKHGEIDLMQYTGLEDKTGREIYEGDIIVPDRPLYYHGLLDKDPITIEWLECGSWYPFADDDDKAPYPDPAKSEVIGNAYENPELIGEDT